MLEDLRDTDNLGIPVRFFGQVPEILYSMAGRVTKLAGLIDIRMLHLLWALEDHTQDVFSDRYGKELEDLVREAAASLTDTKLRKDIGRVLAEAGRLRGKRNAVIHSVWPNPSEECAFAWRAATPAGGQSPTKSFVTSEKELGILIKDMVKIIDELGRLHAGAQREKFARMSEGALTLLATEPRCRVKGCPMTDQAGHV